MYSVRKGRDEEEEKDVSVIYAEPKFMMAHCCKKPRVPSFYGIG